MALGVGGVRVGCWTHPRGTTGCTVVLPPAGTVGGIAVRGAAPGTREAAALGPAGKVDVCHGIVLSGGSAFGLATADGVVSFLEERGLGYPIGDEDAPLARVPIVGAAILLDAAVADPEARPGAEEGRAAAAAATGDDPPQGSVGAGAGATVAKTGGLDHAWRGGQGVAVRRLDEVVVGALVANNAVGDIRDDDGTWIARSRAPSDQPRFPRVLPGGADTSEQPRQNRGTVTPDEQPEPAEASAAEQDIRTSGTAGPASSTVIGCVVTNAGLTKPAAARVADLAHTGTARAVHPAHTSFDGDALFCLATGEVEAHIDVVATLAADAVAEACRSAVRAATSDGDVPGLADHGGR